MTIAFGCPNCKTRLEADDDMAGRAGVCPSCKEKVTVPEKKDKGDTQEKAST